MASNFDDAVPAGRVIDQLRAELRDRDEKVAHLLTALETSRVISAAVGVIMHDEKLTYNEAFDRLNEVSQHTNVKLRAVAEGVLFIGSLRSYEPRP